MAIKKSVVVLLLPSLDQLQYKPQLQSQPTSVYANFQQSLFKPPIQINRSLLQGPFSSANKL